MQLYDKEMCHSPIYNRQSEEMIIYTNAQINGFGLWIDKTNERIPRQNCSMAQSDYFMTFKHIIE